METPRTSQPDASDSLVTALLGFFGITALFLLLPRTLKLLIRKFVLGIAGEIIAVVLTGLLTEKVVEMLERGNHRTPERTPERTP